MPSHTVAEKSKQRIPFGKNGIKDGNGNVIRTDHSTMGDIIRDLVDGGPTKKELLDKRIRDAEAGRVSKLMNEQSKAAGMTRRLA